MSQASIVLTKRTTSANAERIVRISTAINMAYLEWCEESVYVENNESPAIKALEECYKELGKVIKELKRK